MPPSDGPQDFPPFAPPCEHALYEHQHGKQEAALDFYLECSLQIDPQHPFHRSGDMYSNIGSIYEQRGEQGAALTYLQMALALAPGHQLAHYNTGNALRGLSRREEAVASYQRSLTAVYDPRFAHPTAEMRLSQRWKTLSNLGDMLMGFTGRRAEAVAAYHEAMTIAPAEAYQATFNWGVLRYQQNDPYSAAHAFAATLAITPGYVEAYNNLATALQQQARFDESATQFRHALALRPDTSNQAHVFLGDMRMNVGDVAGAQSIFEQARRDHPDGVAGHDRLARLLRTHGRPHEALPLHRAVLRLAPSGADGWYEHGVTLSGLATARSREALHCYRTAAELLPRRYSFVAPSLHTASQAAADAELEEEGGGDGGGSAGGGGGGGIGIGGGGDVGGGGFVSEWFRFLNLRWLQSTTTLRQMRQTLLQQRMLLVSRAFNDDVANRVLAALERSASRSSRWQRMRERDGASYFRRHTLRARAIEAEPALQEVTAFFSTELFGRLLLQLAGINHRTLRQQPQLGGVRAVWYRPGDSERISRSTSPSGAALGPGGGGGASTLYFRWMLTREWSTEQGGLLASCCPLRRVLPSFNTLAVRLLQSARDVVVMTPVSTHPHRARGRRLFALEGWLPLPDGRVPPPPVLQRLWLLPRVAVVNSEARLLEARQAADVAAASLGLPPPPPPPPPSAPPHNQLPTEQRVNETARVLALPAGAVFELDRWLNGSWLHHEHSLGRIGEALRRHRPVTIHNAFRASVALNVLRALAAVPAGAWRREDRWQGGSYASTGFYRRRWVLDDLEDPSVPEELLAALGDARAADGVPDSGEADKLDSKKARTLRRVRRFFDSVQMRALMTRLGGVKLSGNSSVAATVFGPGDHLGPHADVMAMTRGDGPGSGGDARRRLGFTWHLAPQWAAERGGELVFFCPYEVVTPTFNSLTLWSVGGGVSSQMVMPVVEDRAAAAADDDDDDDDDEDEIDDLAAGPFGDEAAGPSPRARLSVSGWFTTTDHERALVAESMVVSMQPCDSTPPVFNS